MIDKKRFFGKVNIEELEKNPEPFDGFGKEGNPFTEALKNKIKLPKNVPIKGIAKEIGRPEPKKKYHFNKPGFN